MPRAGARRGTDGSPAIGDGQPDDQGAHSQIAGLFVLQRSSLKLCVAAIAATPVLVFAILWRLPWNVSGLEAHVRFLIEDARYPRTYAADLPGLAGLALALAPVTLVVMNVVYSLSAYPAGKLSDRMPRLRLLGYGCVVLIAANACLALGDALVLAFAGTILWGLHMGLTEGLIAALVADYAPADLRARPHERVRVDHGPLAHPRPDVDVGGRHHDHGVLFSVRGYHRPGGDPALAAGDRCGDGVLHLRDRQG